jgi:tetratricopeptide (TPR) repeat protein
MDENTKRILEKVSPLVQRKEHMEVIKTLKEAINEGLKGEIISGLLASSYAEIGMKEKAQVCLKDVLKFNQNNYLALFQLGMLDFNTGDYKEAINYLEKVASQPSDFIANYWIAISYIELDKNEQAKPYIHCAYQRVPSNHELKPVIQQLVDSVVGGLA